MLKAYLWLRSLFINDEGQDLVEYALLIVLIALVAIVGVSAAGGWVRDLFSNIETDITSQQAT